MLRNIIAFALGVLIALTFASSWKLISSYGEAEPLHPVAQEFARGLVERLGRENRREMQWGDLTALLGEERFARLRDKAFVPGPRPEVLVTIRINDDYEFPIHTDGTAAWRKPNDA